jgi:hypothetical protein
MKRDEEDVMHDESIAEVLSELHSAALAASQRPESFWTAQRNAVLARADARRASRWKSGWAWVAAAVLVVVFSSIWLEMPRGMPVPDFAAGDDQELLYDVERLVNTHVPLALEPAMMLADEIAAGTAKQNGSR